MSITQTPQAAAATIDQPRIPLPKAIGLIALAVFVGGGLAIGLYLYRTPLIAVTSSLPLVGWALALIPVLIILHHLFYLAWVKSRTVRQAAISDDEDLSALYNASASEYHRFFSFGSLLRRYGLPMLLNFAGVAGVFCVSCCHSEWCGRHLPEGVVQGLRFGGLGAYVYMLLQYGQRSFQGDVTAGCAIWCAVQIVLGAILGGCLSIVWSGELSGTTSTSTSSAAAGLFFLAGLAPRVVVTAVQEGLRRLWLPNPGAAAAAPRSLPLNQLRGITPAIEERLNEEGVFDTYTMALASAIKLLRNTPFDRRQVLGWMDEALLIAFMPLYWEAIETHGFTGSIDLAWLSLKAKKLGVVLTDLPELTALAERLELDAVTLASVIDRMAEDAQLRQVWALYQNAIAEQ